MPRAQIKDKGSSHRSVGARSGKSRSYDHWTRQDLLQRAHQLGITGRSSMTKPQLIDALRSH